MRRSPVRLSISIGATLFVLLAFVLFLSLRAQAPPAPAPTIHPDDLIKPEPLVILKASDPRELLLKIRNILNGQGFSIIKSDSGSIEANHLDRKDDPESDYDRVIIWLERDLEKPAELIKVYLIWGRYELVWGAERAVKRVILNTERIYISELKSAIIALSLQ
jgi:hypothetical protein